MTAVRSSDASTWSTTEGLVSAITKREKRFQMKPDGNGDSEHRAKAGGGQQANKTR